MASQISQQTSATVASVLNESQTDTSPETPPADQSEIEDALDQILSELAGLDSLYTQMDDVSESDLDN